MLAGDFQSVLDININIFKLCFSPNFLIPSPAEDFCDAFCVAMGAFGRPRFFVSVSPCTLSRQSSDVKHRLLHFSAKTRRCYELVVQQDVRFPDSFVRNPKNLDTAVFYRVPPQLVVNPRLQQAQLMTPTGWPKNLHIYACLIICSNIDRFSNLFHCQNQK